MASQATVNGPTASSRPTKSAFQRPPSFDLSTGRPATSEGDHAEEEEPAQRPVPAGADRGDDQAHQGGEGETGEGEQSGQVAVRRRAEEEQPLTGGHP